MICRMMNYHFVQAVEVIEYAICAASNDEQLRPRTAVSTKRVMSVLVLRCDEEFKYILTILNFCHLKLYGLWVTTERVVLEYYVVSVFI